MEDEKLSMKQVQMRYHQCSEHVKRVLGLMDFEKINYDLIETILEHILESPNYPHQGKDLCSAVAET